MKMKTFSCLIFSILYRYGIRIASKGMPWQELEAFNCGWWINNDQESINRTLLDTIALSPEERMQMGINGKRLMRENYSVEILGEKMKQLYEWILNGGEKPEFVYE